jgi:ribosomal protein S17E
MQQTRQKMETIKKAYEILFSDRYSKSIDEAFDHKIAVLEKIAAKQE